MSECRLSYTYVIYLLLSSFISFLILAKDEYNKKKAEKFCCLRESAYIFSRFLRITTMTTIIIKSKKTNVYHSGASGGFVPMQM